MKEPVSGIKLVVMVKGAKHLLSIRLGQNDSLGLPGAALD